MTPTIAIQRDDFDPALEIEAITRGQPECGAAVSFVGLCRDEGGRLSGLELEHYPGMVEDEIGRVVAEAVARWPLLGVTVIHRYGLIRPGERIVLVATASPHREAAFSSADFLMDYLKTRAPFWKREHLANGAMGEWVAARAADERAAEAWRRKSRAIEP